MRTTSRIIPRGLWLTSSKIIRLLRGTAACRATTWRCSSGTRCISMRETIPQDCLNYGRTILRIERRGVEGVRCQCPERFDDCVQRQIKSWFLVTPSTLRQISTRRTALRCGRTTPPINPRGWFRTCVPELRAASPATAVRSSTTTEPCMSMSLHPYIAGPQTVGPQSIVDQPPNQHRWSRDLVGHQRKPAQRRVLQHPDRGALGNADGTVATNHLHGLGQQQRWFKRGLSQHHCG